MTLLSVRNLQVFFRTEHGEFPAVDDVSFDIGKGEILGVVGESGSGKSVSALAIMGLLPRPPARVGRGQVLFSGDDLLAKGDREMRTIRGNRISMIFQEPMTSLNPVFTIGDQLTETMRAHLPISAKERVERAADLLHRVGIAAPRQRLASYPHELSGGMRQRVMIAIALACDPMLLIADEPTTALDVTIQQQILDLILDLREQTGMSVLLITHNIGVVAEVADRAIVMYAGKVVEAAPVRQIFTRPSHPYTRGLLGSIPDIDQQTERLNVIPGSLPNLAALPSGCRFEPRCTHRIAECRRASPPSIALANGHESACIKAMEFVAP